MYSSIFTCTHRIHDFLLSLGKYICVYVLFLVHIFLDLNRKSCILCVHIYIDEYIYLLVHSYLCVYIYVESGCTYLCGYIYIESGCTYLRVYIYIESFCTSLCVYIYIDKYMCIHVGLCIYI